MRLIFMDEAGTSALEPVTVVVGIIVHADEHIMSAEAAVAEAIGSVPKQFSEDFVFHATQVYGDNNYKDGGWSLTDRLILLKTMMSIPQKLRMGLAISAVWRGAVDSSNNTLGLTASQVDHLQAFSYCIGIADRNIRRHADAREVASIVSEDVPEMRKFLKQIPSMLRYNPFYFTQDMMRKTISDEEVGYFTQSGDLSVTRIRRSIHFVEKSDDPLVQVADACAYGLRRFFSNQKFGQDFAEAIVGNVQCLRNFGPPAGAECLWPRAI